MITLEGSRVLVTGGAGFVGSNLVRRLLGEGARVTILDEGDVAFRASRGNFALVWVQSKGLGMPDYAMWSRRSAEQWHELAAVLHEDTGIDVAFMGEAFCGHGYNYDDTTGRCYRGGDSDVWFDDSCEHPSTYGHQGIEQTMLGVVEE